jgi:hypothetical protein
MVKELAGLNVGGLNFLLLFNGTIFILQLFVLRFIWNPAFRNDEFLSIDFSENGFNTAVFTNQFERRSVLIITKRVRKSVEYTHVASKSYTTTYLGPIPLIVSQ